MMEQVASELGVKYKKNGALVVGFDEDDRAHLNELLKRGKENGVSGLKILEKEEIRKIEPEKIICFGSPFDEMQGNIITVDYRESRKVVR